MSQRKSPRQPSQTEQGHKTKHPDASITTAASEAQGLRFAAARLAKSRIGLIGSLTEGREVLDLLKRHPDQGAAAVIGRHEIRLARTFARLEDVTNALAAVEGALARLETGGDQ